MFSYLIKQVLNNFIYKHERQDVLEQISLPFLEFIKNSCILSFIGESLLKLVSIMTKYRAVNISRLKLSSL